MIDQMQDHGTAMFDPAFGKASVIGHEAGHAKIEHTPGILQSLQRKLYHLSPVIAPFSAVGGMAAGLAYQLSTKMPGVDGGRIQMLKADYEQQWQLAADEDREKAAVRFVPRNSFYYS